MLQLLLSQSPDIQKILAFEGAFEKLFAIVQQDGGLDGGVAVRDSFACVDTLLRVNTANQVSSKLFLSNPGINPCNGYMIELLPGNVPATIIAITSWISPCTSPGPSCSTRVCIAILGRWSEEGERRRGHRYHGYTSRLKKWHGESIRTLSAFSSSSTSSRKKRLHLAAALLKLLLPVIHLHI